MRCAWTSCYVQEMMHARSLDKADRSHARYTRGPDCQGILGGDKKAVHTQFCVLHAVMEHRHRRKAKSPPFPVGFLSSLTLSKTREFWWAVSGSNTRPTD